MENVKTSSSVKKSMRERIIERYQVHLVEVRPGGALSEYEALQIEMTCCLRATCEMLEELEHRIELLEGPL